MAERLKHDKQTIADGFADVTVMFADIVNFTRWPKACRRSRCSPCSTGFFPPSTNWPENTVWKNQNHRRRLHGGGGLNNEQDNYSVAIAELALAMRDLLHRDFSVNRLHLEIRIGIGTGPVVAGWWARKKFIYDLWGDTSIWPAASPAKACWA